MAKQYLCELYFDSEKSNLKDLLATSLECLGFVPKKMTIYVTMNKMFEEIPFDKNLLFSIFSENSEVDIAIRATSHNLNVQPLWFKFGNMGNKFVSLMWSNTNLDFLLSSKIEHYLKVDGFAVCYAFDNVDVWEQSRLAQEKKEMDYAIYPGQFKNVCGMQFMAAPKMWFGEPFFNIVSKDTLLQFDKAYINEKTAPNVVQINLFDIYDSADKQENRNEQRRFWRTIDLAKAISKFEEENTIDAAESLKIFLKKQSN